MTDPAHQVMATYAELVAMYERLGEYKPVEPIKLTNRQLAWLKENVEVTTYGPPPPLLGTPIVIVDTVQESTPYVNEWDWPDLEIDPQAFRFRLSRWDAEHPEGGER